MSKLENVRTILNAFLSVLTQPFAQDLKAAVTNASTSILLAGSLAFLLNGGTRTALEFSKSSFVLVLVWMAVTAVFARFTGAVRLGLTMARNLSVVSFWIAVTLVVIVAVERFLVPNPLDRTIRVLIVSVMLLGFILVHTLRNLPVRSALGMTLLLWISTSALAWTIFY